MLFAIGLLVELIHSLRDWKKKSLWENIFCEHYGSTWNWKETDRACKYQFPSNINFRVIVVRKRYNMNSCKESFPTSIQSFAPGNDNWLKKLVLLTQKYFDLIARYRNLQYTFAMCTDICIAETAKLGPSGRFSWQRKVGRFKVSVLTCSTLIVSSLLWCAFMFADMAL